MFKLFSTVTILSFILIGCNFFQGEKGSGRVINDRKTLNGIEYVSLEGIGTINYIQSENEFIEVRIDDNLLKYVDIHISGNKIIISENRKLCASEITYNIALKNPKRFSIAGAGELNLAKYIQLDNLKLELEGVGSIRAENIEIGNLSIEISGAGSAVVRGKADNAKMFVEGVGSIDAENLIVNDLVAEINGVGSAVVHSDSTLKATVSGVGSIKYYGNPKRVTSFSSAIGTIKNMD